MRRYEFFARLYPFCVIFFTIIAKITTFTLGMVVDIHTHNALTHAQTIDIVGVHPWHALGGDITVVEEGITTADAVGEIGLDFACDTPHEEQEQIFRAQLALAEQHQKPVVLHCVRAFEEVMRILRDFHLPAVIFHGFIGSTEQAQHAVKQGYYLSFGERTFRSPKTIRAMRYTPLSHLFVESDESTTPIEDIYARIAELRGVDIATLTEATQANFDKIFSR